ncbi:MAG: hypothetical protein COB83_13125 [Gammaproteobacteria bacterium]|nr:MAG: hypothetical protein COB83_13125 [Gammaproteobacteria bacterium]
MILSFKEQLSLQLSELNFSVLLAYLLPLLAGLTYALLNKLETFTGDEKYRAKMVQLTGLSAKKSLAVQENMPPSSQHKFWQWLLKSNVSYYQKSIRTRNISNHDLIAITFQSVSSIGRYTYFLWLLGFIVFIVIGSNFSLVSQSFFVQLMVMLPAMIITAGTITIFLVVNNKKSLLKRLTITPRFSEKKALYQAFLIFIIGNQTKLYLFVFAIVALLTYTFNYLSMLMYLNVILVGVVLCLFNITIMLWQWRGKYLMENLSVSVMIFSLISAIVFLKMISSDGKVLLWQSVSFISVSIIVLTFFLVNIYRSSKAAFRT